MYITIGNFEDKYKLSVFKKGLNPVFELDEGTAVEMLKKNLTIIIEDNDLDSVIEKLVNSFSNDTEKVIRIYDDNSQLLETIAYNKVYSVNRSLSAILNRIEIVLGW